MVLGGRVAEFWLIVPLFVTGPVHRCDRLLKKDIEELKTKVPLSQEAGALGMFYSAKKVLEKVAKTGALEITS